MAGEQHGYKAVLKIDNAAGTLTTVVGGKSSSLEEAIDNADVTAFEETAKRYVIGQEDADLSFEGSYNPTNVAHIRGIKRMVRDFEYYPGGEASGEEKLAGQLIVTSIGRSSSTEDAAKFSAGFKVTGGVTGTTIGA